jgi:hypothetical protein
MVKLGIDCIFQVIDLIDYDYHCLGNDRKTFFFYFILFLLYFFRMGWGVGV